MEKWRAHQWKLAEEIVAAGLMENLEEAKEVVYDGVMADVSHDHAYDDDLDSEAKSNRTAYYIAERMVMGKDYYHRGYTKEIPEDQRRLIDRIKTEILAKCPKVKRG